MAAAPWNFAITVTSRSEPSRHLVGAFAERAELGQLTSGFRDIGALALEVIVDGAAQARIGDEVSGVGGPWQVAACDLVLALCARLDIRQAAFDGEVDRLIVADLEMQEGMMLYRTPVAAEQRVRSDEVDRARDPAIVAARHHQQHVIAHGLADLRKEFPRQIRPAPFA